MSENHILVWNSRGLNSRARRNVVCDFIEQHRASVVCMQESKLANASISVNIELTGIDYDFAYLSAVGVAGGAYVAWRRNLWNAEHAVVRRFSITCASRRLNARVTHGGSQMSTALLNTQRRAISSRS
jgi:exonuclease III